jgi:hypothetical protein
LKNDRHLRILAFGTASREHFDKSIPDKIDATLFEKKSYAEIACRGVIEKSDLTTIMTEIYHQND